MSELCAFLPLSQRPHNSHALRVRLAHLVYDSHSNPKSLHCHEKSNKTLETNTTNAQKVLAGPIPTKLFVARDYGRLHEKVRNSTMFMSPILIQRTVPQSSKASVGLSKVNFYLYKFSHSLALTSC